MPKKKRTITSCENNYKKFGCEIGKLPFTYLGMPIHHRKLTNKEWKCNEHRFEKKLISWKGKLVSYGGRLILVNSVFTNLPIERVLYFPTVFYLFFVTKDEKKKREEVFEAYIILQVTTTQSCRQSDAKFGINK